MIASYKLYPWQPPKHLENVRCSRKDSNKVLEQEWESKGFIRSCRWPGGMRERITYCACLSLSACVYLSSTGPHTVHCISVYMLLINFVFRVHVIHWNFFCTYIAVTIPATHRISLWDMRLENATRCCIDVTVSSYISVGIEVYVYAVVRHIRLRHSTKHSCGLPKDLY